MKRNFIQARSLTKLALIAALTAAGVVSSSGASAAAATATASGTVVSPIAIAVATNLAFGSFAPGAGGTVTVDTGGTRAASGPILMGAGASSAARFNITGQAGLTYSIVHSGTTVLSNGANTMALTKFSDLAGVNGTSGTATTGTLDGAGAQSLFVGGTLTVAANQVAGVYTGTVIATVEYN
jgi:spore coat protein U-like protein